MTAFSSHSRCLGLIALLLLALGAAGELRGQYGVSLKLPRLNFVAGEPILASVTIANRSGADVFLDAPGEARWLSFNIVNTDGRTFPPLDVQGEKPFILKAGATVARKIPITNSFALSEIGTYAMTASVYHPASGQYFESNRAHFTVMDASPYWNRSVGVPEGSKYAGRIHDVAILVHRDTDITALYARITDDRSRLPILTYQLGPVSLVIEPQITIDPKNQVHVFFLASPKIFCYAIIAPDGELKKRLYYREIEGDRPAMVTTTGGEVAVQGGYYYDPAAAAEAGNTTPQGLPTSGPGRGVSDRPPGL